ncbi:HlyD family efflux transporter periplasmic adaptor subunit [Vogesella indigofera]|uniref:HlyD family efflux transporter periplasmic adaptor subunit n=1 Tax=Vogesella indigofera TaxID=45465 RepID=UPI0035B0F720
MTHVPPPGQAQPPHTTAPARAKTHTLPTLVVSGVLLAGGLAYGAYWLLSSQDRETTEDAYVDGNIVQVTPQTSGTVTTINADNTDIVPAGTVLVTLNPLDARLALQRAEAQLAKAVRQVRGQFSSASQMKATIELRKADLARAQADMQRRAPLVKTGAVSAEDFHHAEEAVQAAQAALAATEQQFAGNQALVDQVSIESHPDVVSAAMLVRDAYAGMTRTALRAPTSGMVTKRNVQVGQRVSPGSPLMSIVPLDHLWVSANFKESQLKDIRIGQSVKVTADVYGNAIEYTGKVLGLDAGTGSTFSLMPAQNATGNWIKVVQRVPVRIALTPEQLAEHPLRLGLSMRVDVDTRQHSGPPLAIAPNVQKQTYATTIFEKEHAGAEEIVSRIIRANIAAKPGRAGKATS